MNKQKVTRRRKDPIAKDLRTPKYRMRVVVSKLRFKREKNIKSFELEYDYGS